MSQYLERVAAAGVAFFAVSAFNYYRGEKSVELFTKERALTSDLRGKMGIEEFAMDRQRLGTTHKPLLSLELTSSDIDGLPARQNKDSRMDQ